MEKNFERVNVTRAKYFSSAVKPEQYPAGEESRPEIVFVGRSNVGKSSLINSLMRVNNLARVSKQPGKTQTINFFDVSLKIYDEEKKFVQREFFLVDVPGYGYAKVGKSQRKFWQNFVEDYLKKSQHILFVCQLIDSRHDLMESDQQMFAWLVNHNLPVLVIATKIDKLSQKKSQENIFAIKNKLVGSDELDILPYSSVNHSGRLELLNTIADALIE